MSSTHVWIEAKATLIALYKKMPFNVSLQAFDRNSTGNQTSTLKSLLTLKVEIRARDPLFYVFLDITYISQIICFISLSLTLSCTKIFDFPKSGQVSHKLFSEI